MALDMAKWLLTGYNSSTHLNKFSQTDEGEDVEECENVDHKGLHLGGATSQDKYFSLTRKIPKIPKQLLDVHKITSEKISVQGSG